MAAKKRGTNDSGPSPEIRESLMLNSEGMCQCTAPSHTNHKEFPRCGSELGFTPYFYHVGADTSDPGSWIAVCWPCAMQIHELGGVICR